MKSFLRKFKPIVSLYSKFKSTKRSLFGPKKFKKKISSSDKIRLVIGSGGYFDEGWIPSDIEYMNLLKLSDWEEFFSEKKIDSILTEHVFEHLTESQASQAIKNCYQYMNSGGYMRMAVPDGYHPDEKYINMVKIGGTGDGADDHKVLYNYQTFKRHFEEAGFKVKMLEYFDEKGEFHFNEWDTSKGMIHRSKRFDARNANGKLNFTSIILDAVKD